MNKSVFTTLFIVVAMLAAAKGYSTNPNPVPKQKQQQPTNCIKQPEIVKKTVPAKPDARLYTEKAKPAPMAKIYTDKNPGDHSIPHFSIFNFFDSFYTKDTLDRLQVM